MAIDIERTEARLKAKTEAARQAYEEAQAELAEFETWKKVGEKYAAPSSKVTAKATVKKVTAKAKAKAKKKVTAKATVKKAASKPKSKADFIRSMPVDMGAKKVVTEAKKVGITVTENHVYGVRSVAKKKKTAKKTAKAATKKTKKVAKTKSAKKTAKTKSATNSVTTSSRKNAAEGRRAVATGERPPLKDSMKTVMGKKTMNAQGVVDALDKKKWLPASSDHRQYISFMLSNNCPDTFERTETRGYYRVAKGTTETKGKNGSSPKKVASKGKKGPQAKPLAPKVIAPKAAPAKPDPKVDKSLKDDWGIDTDVATDPFKDANAAGN